MEKRIGYLQTWENERAEDKTVTVKAPNIVHLSPLTSIGYKKKETKLKNCSQQNKVIIILYLQKVQNEKYFLDL